MSAQELDFSDIAPHDDSVFHEKMSQLVKEPGFLHAVNYTMPKDDVPGLPPGKCQKKRKSSF